MLLFEYLFTKLAYSKSAFIVHTLAAKSQNLASLKRNQIISSSKSCNDDFPKHHWIRSTGDDDVLFTMDYLTVRRIYSNGENMTDRFNENTVSYPIVVSNCRRMENRILIRSISEL